MSTEETNRDNQSDDTSSARPLLASLSLLRVVVNWSAAWLSTKGAVHLINSGLSVCVFIVSSLLSVNCFDEGNL